MFWVICYVVRDVLVLRILAVLAMITIMPHFMIGGHDYHAAWWNLLFIAINSTWIVLILIERRPPKLTPDQQKLYELTFQGCTPRQMIQLLDLAQWKAAEPEEVLVEQGVHLEQLILVHSGTAKVKVNRRAVARLGDGDFVGEMSYLSDEPTTAQVVARDHLRYLVWKRDELERTFEKRVELESALNGVIGVNLVDKLSSVTGRAPELSKTR